MSGDVSRRKMLSLLGLGAALGFSLSGVLEPLEAEAQEAAPAAAPLPHPLPPGPTGCNDVQHGAPVAISDGTRAAPVNLLRPPQQLQRNSDPRRRSWARVRHPTKRTREAHALLVREYSRNERSTVSASKSPPRFAGLGFARGR